MDITLRLTDEERDRLLAYARVSRRPVDDIVLEMVRRQLAESDETSRQVREWHLSKIASEDSELLRRLADS